jgi:hypothetical protein
MIKRIEKVWGYENWIGGNDSDYFLKKIFLKKDNQSSLQYHSRKEETILLYNGNAELTYKTDKMKNLTSENLSKTNLYPCTVIHNKPYEIHRIKAHTDIILFEASTPDLDDVVRIQI